MHGPHNQHCPKCIIDDGILAAAARLFAATCDDRDTTAEAMHLAFTAEAVKAATECALKSGAVTEEQADELHAMSELSCHRAAELRAWARGEECAILEGGETDRHIVLQIWAEELRLHTTGLIGGEYDGAWEVIGVNGIRKKE